MSSDPTPLAARVRRSLRWTLSANLVVVALLFARSVLLARLVAPEAFGTYTMALSIVLITLLLGSFGLNEALLHRAPETEDEGRAAALHFTLSLLLGTLWALLLVAGALLWASGALRTALLALAAIRWVGQLAQTPVALLTRRVEHRRLALDAALTALLTTVGGVALAARGAGLWALLATDLLSVLSSLALFYLWRPVWQPRLAWDGAGARYFLRFGSRSLTASLLSRLLDRLDDLWTGALLGERALGFYSRAYNFATYPGDILAKPVNQVAGGAYAELKHDQAALGAAFYRANALLVRGGFFLAGGLALVAPEFIVLLLGARWLPMLDAFRLMLLFTLLDPIKGTVAALFVALGEPGRVVRARLVQLAVLVAGLALLAPRGIAGVALAVDAMALVGVGLLLFMARRRVPFSPRRLFAAPLVALLAAFGAAALALWIVPTPSNPWLSGALKGVPFALAYVGVLLALEGRRAWGWRSGGRRG